MLHYADIIAALAAAGIDLDDLCFEHGYVGIRIQESDFGLRADDAVDHRSLVWDHGFETEDELPGVCALDARHFGSIASRGGCVPYIGRTVLLLGANRVTYGEDEGELIMEDATVLAVLHL